jgi:hypothetical protein
MSAGGPADTTRDGYQVDRFVATPESEEEAVHDREIALCCLRACIITR